MFRRCFCAFTRTWNFALLLMVFAATGCSQSGIKLYPVHGSVNVDGQPADGVRVVFCPVGGSEEFQRKYRPSGITGPDGKFTLMTLAKDDGAPAGEYKVIAQWLGNTTDKFGRPSLGDVDKLQSRYMDLAKSQIQVTIKGATDLPPFELKTK